MISQKRSTTFRVTTDEHSGAECGLRVALAHRSATSATQPPQSVPLEPLISTMSGGERHHQISIRATNNSKQATSRLTSPLLHQLSPMTNTLTKTTKTKTRRETFDLRQTPFESSTANPPYETPKSCEEDDKSTRIARRKTSNHFQMALWISKSANTTNITVGRQRGATRTMIPLVFVVLLSAIIVHQQHQLVQCDRSQQQHPSTDTERNHLDTTTNNNNSIGDLVAIGAISLVEHTQGRSQATGRLVDRIASPALGGGAPPGGGGNNDRNNKLDYIVDFMRTNKLTKFCDLLTSQEPEIINLNQRLNLLSQFTLFVPTNEALLLMPSGQLEQIKSRPDEMKQFLMAHATGELVVPKLNLANLREPTAAPTRQQQQQSSTSLMFSLAGSPLRVTTAAIQQVAPPVAASNNQTGADSRSTKLELIVNGANIISGHSYALQEPNNSSVTYAIVHLVDRVLYPVPSANLMNKVQLVAPKMAKYIWLARDSQVSEALESTNKLTTMFLPNDDAFRATPSKLLDQLDTNRTFLVQFLRAHLIEGLYYSSQLANFDNGLHAPVEAGHLPPDHQRAADNEASKLSSLSGSELEFESKTLQSRTLVLVNSIPILEPDIMTLNGVIHLITRPIFERHLLEDCRCGSNHGTTTSRSKPTSFIDQTGIYEKLWPKPTGSATSNSGGSTRQSVVHELDSQPTTGSVRNTTNSWFADPDSRSPAAASGENPANGNELEREESQLRGQTSDLIQRLRSQRSGNLVARNNRDFYRPSAAPANLLLTSGGNSNLSNGSQQQSAELRRLDGPIRADGQIFITRDDFNQLLGATNNNQSRVSSSITQEESNSQRLVSAGSDSQPSRWLPDRQVSLGSEMFEVERYKVVLNATSRQRMREQQRTDPSPATMNPQFAYDRPLSSSPSSADTLNSPTTEQSSNKRLYSPVNLTSPSINTSSWNNDQLAVSNTNRQQRLLKFQIEDARDPLPGTRIQNITTSASSRQANLQPAYDMFGSSSTNTNRAQVKEQQLTGKTVPPPGFGGCAFYDTDCKRLVGKLVRLPSMRQKSIQTTNQQVTLTNSSSSNVPQRVLPDQHLDSTFGETTERPPTTITSSSWTQPGQSQAQQQQQKTSSLAGSLPIGAKQPFTRLNSPRLSPLNQPLPPWSEEEHRAGQPLSPNWRAQDGDIARITGTGTILAGSLNQPILSSNQAHGFTNGLSRGQISVTRHQNNQIIVNSAQQQQQTGQQQQQVQTQRPPTAQIVLMPIKILHDTGPGLISSQLIVGNITGQTQQQHQQFDSNQNQLKPVFFSPSISTRQQQSSQLTAQVNPKTQTATRGKDSTLSSSSLPKNITVSFNANQQYHTPTPYSVSLVTTHMPPMFNSGGGGSSSGSSYTNNPQLGRLTNFTAIESFLIDEPAIGSPSPATSGSDGYQQPGKSLRVQNEQISQIPRAPSAHRKQRLQQIQIDNNGSFGANFELNPANGEKQARKIVRLQPTPPGTPPVDDFNGDISITSARLSSPHSSRSNFTLDRGLATQASDQAPNVSANFVRSVPINQRGATGNSGADQSADFFQNRTIAEIMDDSGLRIDGQQVTFSRLKDCLTEADLLSLVTQTGNSLTIFMPTDSAFQRLVQQQALAHQRERERNLATSSGGRSSRLFDSSRRYLIPLVGRKPGWQSESSINDDRRHLFGDGSSSRLFMSVDSSIGVDSSSASDRLTLDCSSNQVRQILLDHLSARLITPKQLQTDMGISSLSGRQLLLSSVPSKKIVVVDGQPVIAATRAKNGMVYVVNKFLNLTQQVPNVMDLIEQQPNLTTFLSYLSFSSLADRLKRETGPLTILAPTNEAFEQLSSSARQLINSDPAALMDILRGHVVEGAQFGKLISMRNRLKTMNSDQNIEAKVIKPNVYLLDNQMTSMRLVGTTGNGVVNTIDRLIVPSWLKAAKPQVGGSSPATSLSDTSHVSNGSRLGLVETLDIPAGRNSTTTTSLNLPVISSQPVRFDQPGSRLNTPNGSNSFLLANTNTNTNGPLDNSLLDFDLPAGINVGSSSFDNQQPPSTTPRSPFLRVATNLTGGVPSSGNRLHLTSIDDRTLNVTKNMQLIEKLANLMQAKRFVKYLFRSRVSETLKPDMNYVILVPTDQAIEKLPKQIIDMLERDLERLADLVNYHVLDTTFEYINTIPDGQTLNTLNEKDILFNWHRNSTILTASGAVVMGGIQEENIALLIVDRVLYPTPGDILNIISKSPILSNFTSLVRNAGLEQQLSLAGPYTLFAPSDFAFNQLDKRDLEFLQRNKETARRFLLRHLSQPAVFTSSIALSNATISRTDNSLLSSDSISRQQQQVPTMTVSNSLGEDLTLRQRNDYFSVNDVNFSYADVAATNGVVHVIDGLL